MSEKSKILRLEVLEHVAKVGLSSEQVAKVLGISKHGVRSIVHKHGRCKRGDRSTRIKLEKKNGLYTFDSVLMVYSET